MSASRGTAKGLFIQGVWNCDCSPPLPAVHLQTSKPGTNHGRWFRTCNKPPGKQCKFFLWDDDAPARENSAVANMATPPTSSRKRTRSVSNFADNYHSVKVKEEYDLDEVLIQTEMPSKAAKMASYSTPVTKRCNLPWETGQSSSESVHGLHTPQTGSRTQGDFIDSRTPRNGDSPCPSSVASQNNAHHVGTPYSTPCTCLNRMPNPSQNEGAEDQELVNDTFDLLQKSSIRLPNHTQEELKALLTKHVKRTEGYRRGRDVTRLTVKAKDARITELTYRVSTLEAELEAEKAMVKHLQWKARNRTSYFD